LNSSLSQGVDNPLDRIIIFAKFLGLDDLASKTVLSRKYGTE
jgi:hypothetical protein